ncbi:bifunctional pyr operon transcriptional regulator/uracil phosphoribosyltransferase PyrR [Halomonas sp. PR-M31]|uniref:bifunctional pyr operon transcriptional regulator/uracil phosphoribosyltransferase PyrR n=1 Tax=Halomonas sp. PR-M31 TaxID=1471202 RepID=UPI000B338445
MSLPDIPPLLDAMIADLETIIDEHDLDRQRLAMVGIHTGGAWIADALHQRLALPTPLGTLDIGFWRDDFSHQGLPDAIRASHLPFDVDERDLVLVDDVVMSGRTIRAALNELFDYGRRAGYCWPRWFLCPDASYRYSRMCAARVSICPPASGSSFPARNRFLSHW